MSRQDSAQRIRRKQALAFLGKLVGLTAHRRPSSAISLAVVIAYLGALILPTAAMAGQAPALPAPTIHPLSRVGVPDVNWLGLLDQNGGIDTRWPRITKNGQRLALRQLGKALFFDMQLGGDGVQSCASCHYHAGADNRKTNQLSPGIKGGDNVHQLNFGGPNATLTQGQFPLPVSQAEQITAGAIADQALTPYPGAPGTAAPVGNVNSLADVNDVVSSQGVRLGTFHNISPDPVDYANLALSDPAGFNTTYTSPVNSMPSTVRRVEPRNTPTTLNAVFNLRNFWDGRADSFFNGVNPLGFRDPDARVQTYVSNSLVPEKLRIPFSSLASQAVGPPLSQFEMHFDPRKFADLGKKMIQAKPLDGQAVAVSDSLLGTLRDGSGTGLTGTYATRIRDIFDERFWGNGTGQDVCVNASGQVLAACPTVNSADPAQRTYTLMEWNFALFFGLAVQAYEATLVTGETIVDLLNGGIAKGTVTIGTGRNAKSFVVDNQPLEACIVGLARNNNAAEAALTTERCTAYYAKFIRGGAVTGKESALAPFGTPLAGNFNNVVTNAIPVNTAIGNTAANCIGLTGAAATNCAASPNQAAAQGALLNIDRGMGRFFAGATGCGICHFNPEFNGATVSALTGFGMPPPLPEPPGLLRKAAPERPMERMVAFNGATVVYDSGFYNLGVRPTPEDLSIGDQIGGVPLAFTRLAQIINGGQLAVPNVGSDSFLQAQIDKIAAELAVNPGTGLNELRIPTSLTIDPITGTATANLTPRPFTLDPVICGPGTNNNGAGEPNNNPNPNCLPNVQPLERLLRNGAFKASGLRNVKFTGPFFHNGSKMDLRQVVEFYKTAGHFNVLNLENLDAGLRVFNLGVADEAALVEMLETGLTDWRVAYEMAPFDHPQICVPHGHDSVTGRSKMAGIPAVGASGNAIRLQTFEEQLAGTAHTHNLGDACTVTGVALAGSQSAIDVPGPRVLSINRTTASGTAGNPVSWTVTFSDLVGFVDPTDFALINNTAGALITSVVQGATADVYTVTASTAIAGAVQLQLVDDNSIRPLSAPSVPLTGIGSGDGSLTGQSYTIQ